ERKKHKTCLSAQDGVDINLLLQEIIDKDVYKSDYESITSSLLFEEIEYCTAVKALQIIIDSKLFQEVY
ncbi:MAG: nucleotidyl transferase AbiEii/AbiGii toxin family protein, partial [Eubacterium sp.]|nr:nucleotidyl transferase AbiEii/AbiGii toxin family protein [Eubacterium sp.]